MGNCFKSPLLGLTVGAVCLGGGIASATNQSVEVAVWGVDSSLQVADVFALLPDGTESHATALPGGTYQLDGLTAKSRLFVETEFLGAAWKEITLQAVPMSLVDVLFVAEDQAEFLMDLGPNAKRMSDSSAFVGRPPVNDLQSGAMNIAVPSVTGGSTAGATVDSGMAEGPVPITSPGVWYLVPGTGTTMSASTCGTGSDFDTKLSVFCTGPDQTMVAGDDDSAGCGDPLQSAVSWCSQEGEHYLILVHGYGGQAGRFELTVDADAEPCTGGVQCSSGGTDIVGACCLPNQECIDGVGADECIISLHGTWGGPGSTCCPQPGSFDGYLVTDCDHDFVDIHEFGNHGPHGSNESSEVPIGFDFKFFNSTYSIVTFGTNGYLTFGSDGTDPDNTDCNDPNPPNNYIAPLWDDLFAPPLVGTFYATVGPPGSRQFIAQWAVIEGVEPLSIAIFQAVLSEETHCIEFRYHTLFNVPSFPGDTTVGIENFDGSWAYCVPDSELEEGVCIRFCPIYTPPTPGQDCPCVTIDFETDDSFDSYLVNGEQVWENVNGLFGELIHIEAYGSGVDGACIFDTDPAGPNNGGPDPDLLVDKGNALICQSVENPEQTVAGIYDVPNDPSTGGNIEIHFLDGYDGGYGEGVATQSIDLIDVCNTDSSVPLQVRLWDHYGNCRVYSVPRGWTTDIVEDGGAGCGTLYLDTLAPQPGYEATATATDCGPGWFDEDYVVWIEINGNGSFGVDNLHFCRHLEPCDGPPPPTGN